MRPVERAQEGVRLTIRPSEVIYDQASMKDTPTCLYSLAQLRWASNRAVHRLAGVKSSCQPGSSIRQAARGTGR